MRHVDDAERRRRLARRHAIAPWARGHTAEDAARAVVALHATEPASVPLAVAARTEGVGPYDVRAGLDHDRTLVVQLAMRRTLFAMPRDLLPAVWGSASARVAETERRRIGGVVLRAGLTDEPDRWLADAAAAVEALLADGVPRSTRAIREQVPHIDVKAASSTSTWGSVPQALAPQVLTWLGAAGRLARAVPEGAWHTARPTWTTTGHWLGAPADPLPAAEGYAELVRRWLRAFGPGTETDLVWWLGSTKSAVRRALADVGAVTVTLDGGGTGWVLPDDLDPEPADEPWVALLPVLDPTTMGWKERAFYLREEDRPYLFDSVGNGGTTAWVDGEVVGCWVQDPDARVRVVLRRDPGAHARTALDAEAERLTAWFDGVRISSVFASSQMRGETLR